MARRVLLLAAAAVALPPTLVAAQGPECLSLRGSEQCPSFQDAYINPTNLSTRFSWFSQVNDVATFDEQFALYFSDPSRFTAEKKQRQLACNGSGIANTTLQWERTIMCGKFTQMSYSEACNVQAPTMICQDTCRSWSAAQTRLVENPALCAPEDQLTAAQNRTRADTLTRDFVACTDWTTLVSTNNATCVEGRANEGNCGYGPGVSTELCTACDPSGNRTIDACCFDQNTSLSQCASYGHPAAAAIIATTSVATGLATPTSSSSSQRPTNSGAAGSSASENSSSMNGAANLSSGALAGLIIGVIIGALVLGAFLALVVFRRRRNGHQGGIAPMYAAHNGARSGSTEKPWQHSEDGMGHGRSMDASPLSNEKGIGGSGGAALAGAGVGAGVVGAAAAAAGSSRDHSSEDRQERPISGVTTQSSGTDGRGTTVPMVRDQYTGQDIYPGEEVIAIYPYNASLNDEITLEPEQLVTIVRLYDDGWALGRTSDGTEGALPLVCVSSTKGEIPRVGGTGSGTTGTGTGTEDDGMTSGNEFTSDADGAVTADEGFTSDAPSRRH